MNTFITVVIGISCLVVMHLFNRPILSVSGLFIIMWTLCLGLATLGLYGMNKPSITVVALSSISMFIFMVSSISRVKYKRIIIGSTKVSFGVSSEFGKKPLTQNRLLYLFNFAAYIFSIPYLKNSLYIMLTKGIYFVREGAFNGTGGIASTAILMIFQYIISPLFLTTIILTAIDINNKNTSIFSIIVALINIVLYTMLFAGRFMILEALLLLLIVAIDTDMQKNIMRFIRRHMRIIILVALLFFGLVYVTLRRSSSSFLKNTYVYFCGSFSYLSYLIDNRIGTDLFLLGKALCGFIYNTICTFLTGFFNFEYKGSNHIITQLTQYMVPIGVNIRYNSMGTMLHDFIADFGVYGCIIDVCIYSHVCNYIERLASIKRTDFAKALYYYILISIVFSVLSYQFRGPGAFFTIFFIYLFTHHRRSAG